MRFKRYFDTAPFCWFYDALIENENWKTFIKIKLMGIKI